jgi:hypothetical protein
MELISKTPVEMNEWDAELFEANLRCLELYERGIARSITERNEKDYIYFKKMQDSMKIVQLKLQGIIVKPKKINYANEYLKAIRT